jgi:hypothetical protein
MSSLRVLLALLSYGWSVLLVLIFVVLSRWEMDAEVGDDIKSTINKLRLLDRRTNSPICNHPRSLFAMRVRHAAQRLLSSRGGEGRGKVASSTALLCFPWPIMAAGGSKLCFLFVLGIYELALS